MSGSSVGSWTSLTAVDPSTQKRCYSAPAYYLPAAYRKNLVLLTEAMVQDILLEKDSDHEGWTAKGVRFKHGGVERIIHASAEIILCAGTVQSPQLLELSGIGNPEMLKKAGIGTKVANANVGENLQEHMSRIPTRFR